jgi:hypothetical protein
VAGDTAGARGGRGPDAVAVTATTPTLWRDRSAVARPAGRADGAAPMRSARSAHPAWSPPRPLSPWVAARCTARNAAASSAALIDHQYPSGVPRCSSGCPGAHRRSRPHAHRPHRRPIWPGRGVAACHPGSPPRRARPTASRCGARPAEQPGDKPADPSAGLRPLEARPDPVDEPLQRLGAVGDPLLGRLPDPHDAPHNTAVHPRPSSPSTQQAPAR